MQRLTAAEVEGLSIKETGPRESKVKHIYDAIDQIGVGDALRIETSEWPYKSKPSQSGFPARVVTNNRQYTVRMLVDNSAFIVIRKA